MNYQDGRSWPVIKSAVALSLKKGFADASLDKNSSPDVLQGRREEIWERASELLPRSRNLKGISEEHGRDYTFLASELLDALFLDRGAIEPRPRQSAWMRLVNMLARKGVLTACTNVITEVRDRMDIQGYLVAAPTVEEDPQWPEKWRMTSYRLDKLRTIDTFINGLDRLFANWTDNLTAVEDILGHPIYRDAEPIEIRAFRSNGTCKADWILRWSERWGPHRKNKKGEVVWRPLHGGHTTPKVWAMADLEGDIADVVAQLAREAKRAEDSGETRAVETKCNRPGPPQDDVDWLQRLYDEVSDAEGGGCLLDDPEKITAEGFHEDAGDDGDGDDGDEPNLDEDQEFSRADEDDSSRDDVVAQAIADRDDVSEADMDLPAADGEGLEALAEKCFDPYPPAILGYMVLDLANWNIDRARGMLKKKRVFELLGIPEYIAKLPPKTYLQYAVDDEATDREQQVRKLTAEAKLAMGEMRVCLKELLLRSSNMKSGEKR